MAEADGVHLQLMCDLADERKDDLWQAYAAYTSARVIQEFFDT